MSFVLMSQIFANLIFIYLCHFYDCYQSILLYKTPVYFRSADYIHCDIVRSLQKTNCCVIVSISLAFYKFSMCFVSKSLTLYETINYAVS